MPTKRFAEILGRCPTGHDANEFGETHVQGRVDPGAGGKERFPDLSFGSFGAVGQLRSFL